MRETTSEHIKREEKQKYADNGYFFHQELSITNSPLIYLNEL
jgi:hypothetical protein